MYNRNKTVIIDFQYLVGNCKQIFIKELSIFKTDQIGIVSHLFCPPFPEEELTQDAKNQNQFCANHINKLKWKSGWEPYTSLSNILGQFKNATVLVHSLEKQQFLLQYLPDVQIVESIPAFKDLPYFTHNCEIHNKTFPRCSKLHCSQIYVHLERENMLI